MATLVAFVLLAACTAALAWFVPDQALPKPMWLFVFIAIAAASKFAWSHERAPQRPAGWLSYVLASVTIALVFVVVDVWLYGLSTSHLVFDLALGTLCFLVALTCLVRSLLLPSRNAA